MKNKKNYIFFIIVPILCIIIATLFIYDRYQTNQLAKKFMQENEIVTSNQPDTTKEVLPTIYCVGDSTTLGSNENPGYPSYLKNSINTTINTIGDNYITSAALTIKLGINEVYVNNFTIPGDLQESVITLLDKDGKVQNDIFLSKTNIDNCKINDIEGSITYDETNKRLVFKRTTAGTNSNITTLTKVEITKPEIVDNNILVLFTGSYEESVKGSLAEYQKQIITAFNTDRYVIVSLTQNNRDETNTLLENTFGEHFLNFKTYLLENGLNDAGINATSQDQNNIINKNIPASLLADELNGNSKYNELLAQQIAAKIQSLGYINK